MIMTKNIFIFKVHSVNLLDFRMLFVKVVYLFFKEDVSNVVYNVYLVCTYDYWKIMITSKYDT